MGISKTAFMRGMQCRKMLWLDRHKRELRVIPPETQAIMDAGNEFGDQAMSMFGPYEEMTVYLEEYLPDRKIPDTKAMVQKTQDALQRGVKVICEAGFSYYNNYCAVDILRKTETGYDVYEVKNTPDVEDPFILDAAFQNYILSRCGLKIDHIYIVTHGPNEENPFVPVEITEEAREYYDWINDNIWELNKLQYEPDEIMVGMGNHCKEPYECWYCDYCRGLRDPDTIEGEEDE